MYDVIIVGAGASGTFCALSLKYNNPNLNVLLLEKNDKLGKKLLITGNGRCNIGNKNINISDYNSNSSLEYFKKIIETGSDNYAYLLKTFGVFITNEENRLYPCSNQALTVCKSFERALINYGVEVKYNYDVNNINKVNDMFIINNSLKSKMVVIATGGKTYSKTGSTGMGYELLKSFGHNITNLYPSLTSLKTNFKYIKDLAGVRVNSKVSLYDSRCLVSEEQGQLQFTKDSLSGICIFNLSRYIGKLIDNKKELSVKVDFMPDNTFDELYDYIKSFSNYNLEDAISCILNNKLAMVIAKNIKLAGKKVSSLSDSDLTIAVENIKNMKFDIIGTGDFENAQVTCGGVFLNEFTSDLESNKCKGLYAIGEVLDVDGKCGGYNLSWAFNSALIVSNIISKK